MIFDCLATVGRHFTGEDIFIDDYLTEMETHGIDRALLCPRKPKSYSAADANDFVRRIPDEIRGKRFLRALRIDPWRGEEMRREMQAAFLSCTSSVFVAAYMHPWEDSFRCNDKRVFPFYEFLEGHGVPLVMETGYPWVSHISQIWEIAKLYPALKILASNAGQLDLSGLTLGNVSAALKVCPNIYLGTAAAVAADWLREAAENWAHGRVVFTSSYPMFEPEMERYRIDHGYLSDEMKREIYEANPKRFLGR